MDLRGLLAGLSRYRRVGGRFESCRPLHATSGRLARAMARCALPLVSIRQHIVENQRPETPRKAYVTGRKLPQAGLGSNIAPAQIAGSWMIATLRTGFGFRIAFAMAAFAAFALIAPPMAVAFAPAERAAHCLTHTSHPVASEHAAPASAAAKHEHGPAKAKHSQENDEHPSKCCGLFCVTAIAPAIDQLPNRQLEGAPLAFPVADDLYRRLAELHFRPPISPLSFWA